MASVELRAAVSGALARLSPRLFQSHFILTGRRRSADLAEVPVDLSRHPELTDLSVLTPQL